LIVTTAVVLSLRKNKRTPRVVPANDSP